MEGMSSCGMRADILLMILPRSQVSHQTVTIPLPKADFPADSCEAVCTSLNGPIGLNKLANGTKYQTHVSKGRTVAVGTRIDSRFVCAR